MKTKMLSAAFALMAGTLFAAEANLYSNPKFESTTDKNGKLVIQKHYYEGDASLAGEFEGNPVIRFKLVKVNWGGFSAMMGISNGELTLNPGKYTFSVWCNPEGVMTSVYLFRFVQPAGGERIRPTKSYKGSELPPVGKWTELVMDFEIKPGDTKNSIGFGAYSTADNASQVIFFANPRITPVNGD